MFDGLGSSATHIKGGRIRAARRGPRQKRAPGVRRRRADRPAEAGVPAYQVAHLVRSCGRRRARPKTSSSTCRPTWREAFATSDAADELEQPGHPTVAEPRTRPGRFPRKFVQQRGYKRWPEVVVRASRTPKLGRLKPARACPGHASRLRHDAPSSCAGRRVSCLPTRGKLNANRHSRCGASCARCLERLASLLPEVDAPRAVIVCGSGRAVRVGRRHRRVRRVPFR